MALLKTILRVTRYIFKYKFHTSAVWNISDSSTRDHTTAGLIVIGDEILKGQVADTNSHFIAKHLFDLGVKVMRISVIGDDEEVISREVRSFSKQFTYVLTTGGIGPTHDDVTYKAIAMAFGEPLQPHPELVKLCSDFYKTDDLNSPGLKLAHVPASAKLYYGFDKVSGRRTLFPNVAVRNVYIYPGIPQLMERLFTAVHKDLFGASNVRFFTKELYLSTPEIAITEHLNTVVANFPEVTFGSYPKLLHSYYKVQLTVQSPVEEEMQRAYDALRAKFPEDIIVDYDKAPVKDAYSKVEQLMKVKQNLNIQNTLQLLEGLYKDHEYNELYIYIHGGKSSTALLHLLHACLRKNKANTVIHAVRVVDKNTVSEVEHYIKEAETRYNLAIEVLEGPLESVLKQFLSQQPYLKTVVYGSHSEDSSVDDLQAFIKSSAESTNIKWINPLECWSSSEVWDFVRSLYLPYCVLYDKGYKSITNVTPKKVAK